MEKKIQSKKSSPDAVEKILEEHPDVFADIINGLIYNGKDIVKPENLVDGPTAAMYKAAEGNINQKDRDVSKSDVKKGIEYAIYGAENQTSINRIMPVRIMGYDYASYDRSINKLKAQNRKEKREANYAEEIHPGQKVCPVVTLVLYFGSKRWDGPKTLHDMLDIPEALKPYVPNYSINLIEVAFLPDITIECFKSDFRLVAEFFKAKRLGKLKEWDYNKKKIIHMAELMEFFATFTNNKRFEEIKEAMVERAKKGEVTMYEPLGLVSEEELAEAEEKGKAEGRYQDVEKLISKMGLSKEEAMDTLEFTAAEVAGYEAWKTKASE